MAKLKKLKIKDNRPKGTYTGALRAWRGKLRVQADGRIWAWHFHHGILAEGINPEGVTVKQVVKNRLGQIRLEKLYKEQPERFLRLRPVRGKISKEVLDGGRASSQTEVKELHAKECKDCPWNGKTLFRPRRA